MWGGFLVGAKGTLYYTLYLILYTTKQSKSDVQVLPAFHPRSCNII